jgi:aryl-alcohol dehydrogenase-like predicted oxidoreductase
MKKDRELDRRNFLKKAPAAIVGLAAAAGAGAGISDLARAAWGESVQKCKAGARTEAVAHAGKAARGESAAKVLPAVELPKIQHYRPLGKTGIETCDISMGAAVNDSVIKYALDRGINFFDTADSYYMGQGEEALGKALKGIRDECVVSTKHMVEPSWKKDTLMEKVNASLKRLNTDYVDMLFIQGVGDPALFENQEIMSGYEELKKQGKYRFLCFSTHDTDLVVPAAIETGLFSSAMLMYIPGMFPKMEEMHTKLYEAGIGIIAMKVLKGGEGKNVQEKYGPDLTYAQAAIRWALKDKKISTVLISMRTFEHINEYLGVSGSGLS